jgi:hypothetical protein
MIEKIRAIILFPTMGITSLLFAIGVVVLLR